MLVPKSFALIFLLSLASANAFLLPRRAQLSTSYDGLGVFRHNQTSKVGSGLKCSLQLSRGGDTDVEEDKSIPSFLFSVIGRVFGGIFSVVRKLVYIAQELMTGGFLAPQTQPLVYGSPLGGEASLEEEEITLALRERSCPITESFDVQGPLGTYCKVRGIKYLLSGGETLRLYLEGEKVAVVKKHRKDPTYKIFRGQTSDEIGDMKKVNGDYEFYAVNTTTAASLSNTTEPVILKPYYKLTGNFLERRFVMKNSKNQAVAKIRKRLIAFPMFDHYTVRIAPGMDPIMVISCLIIIDEELDEELKNKYRNIAIKMGKTGINTGKFVGKISVKGGKRLFSRINPFANN